MSKSIRQTKENFASLRKSFMKFHDDFPTTEKQFNALKVLDVSPKSSSNTHSTALRFHKVVSPLSPSNTFC